MTKLEGLKQHLQVAKTELDRLIKKNAIVEVPVKTLKAVVRRIATLESEIYKRETTP